MTIKKTFSDLVFNAHANVSNGVQAMLDLGNDLEISVVSMKDGKHGLYGDVRAGTYEVAVFHNNEMLPLQASDDVRGWQTEDELTELMARLQGVQARLARCAGFVASLYINRRKMRAELGLD